MAVAEDREQLGRLQQALLAERQKTLNLTDAIVGAQASTAQAKTDNDALFDRLHHTATELARLKVLFGYEETMSVVSIEAELNKPWVGPPKVLGHFASKAASRAAVKGAELAERVSARHRETPGDGEVTDGSEA